MADQEGQRPLGLDLAAADHVDGVGALGAYEDPVVGDGFGHRRGLEHGASPFDWLQIGPAASVGQEAGRPKRERPAPISYCRGGARQCEFTDRRSGKAGIVLAVAWSAEGRARGPVWA